MANTPNKNLVIGAHGSDVNTWDSVIINPNSTAIDTALGGSTSISVAAASGVVALISTQYIPPNITFTGLLTANVNYQLPSGVGGIWSILNSTSGAFTVTFSSAAGGGVVVIPVGVRLLVICDGSAVGIQAAIGIAGSNTQILFNSNGVLGASSGLTWDGTNLTATNFAGAAVLTALTAQGLTVGLGLGAVASNTALGISALAANTTGADNTAVGDLALTANTTGGSNIAVGGSTLAANTTGSGNTAVGYLALPQNTTGQNNTAVGGGALNFNVGGTGSTAIGSSALASSTGVTNTAVGAASLFNCTTGSNNFAIGANSGADPLHYVTTDSNVGVLGNNSTTVIYSKVALTVVSDERDKTEFKEVPHGLEFVESIAPGMFRLKNRETGQLRTGDRYGFSAQQILALEGKFPVITDTFDPEHLKIHDHMLVPILWNAVRELSAKLDLLETHVARRHPGLGIMT